MELAAVVLVAGYGYLNSWKSQSRTLTSEKNVSNAEASKKYKKLLHEAGSRAKYPATTGVVLPGVNRSDLQSMAKEGLLPFFKSGRTMASNDHGKQRKLETFTGGDPAWKSKHVGIASEPTPQGLVTSGGSVNNNLADNRQPVVRGTVMNNVSPVEKIRVGPGLGIGPDKIAEGGFHQFYRVLPSNINSHRLTSLRGEVVIGAPLVGKPAEATMEQTVERRANIGEFEDRPPLPSGAAVSARAPNPTFTKGSTGARGQEADIQWSMQPVMTSPTVPYATAPKPKPNANGDCLPAINYTGEKATGAYVANAVSAKPTQRGEKIPHVGLETSIVQKETTRPTHGPKITNRELANDLAFRAALDLNRVSIGPNAPKVGTGSGLLPTKRAQQKCVDGSDRVLPKMQNMFTPESMGKARIRERNHKSIQMHGKQLIPNVPQDRSKRVRQGKKVSPFNPHMPSDMIEQQLAANPYAILA
jgi:hypothetical protein